MQTINLFIHLDLPMLKSMALPKIHKLTDSDSFSKLRPIVPFVGTFNYNLAKYLCNLLSPHLPEQYCTKDTFTFVEQLKRVSLVDKFLVSFDVTSLYKYSIKQNYKIGC